MTCWLLKAMVQGGISLLPKPYSWNYLFQKHVTKSLSLSATGFESKLMQCRRHIENYFATEHAHRTSFSVLELGTGWHPIVPLGLWLCGASSIWTIDKNSLLHIADVREILSLFAKYARAGNLIEALPWICFSRVSRIKKILREKDLSTGEILAELDIYALVRDARDTGLDTGSIDLFVSDNTLEHIPEETLQSIFLEFRRIASPGAVMSHFVDMSDHYASFDHSITPYNHLKYPNYVWRLFNNSLDHENRLCIPDYRRIHKDAGFKIIYENNQTGPPCGLDSIRVARQFRRYSRDELLIVGSWIVSALDSQKLA